MHSRRRFLQQSILAASGVTFGTNLEAQLRRDAIDSNFVVKNGNIRQSIMGWTFKDHYNTLELAKHCKDIGIVAMEGIPRESYADVKKMGLEISLVASHGFAKGPCNPEFQGEVIAKLDEAIDVAKSVGSKSVITFTGMTFDGLDRETGAKNCVDTWKKVIGKAEKEGITITLEHLNSRDDSHPMKGHPGYFGDDVDFCVEMINQVGSDHFKLLFDIYHVSVMNGDIIRRIRQYKDVIGHYHTAGNPGRAELDDTQEINFPAILQEVLKTGYTGFVAQEFIPEWDNPLESLRHAAQLCDI